MRSVVDVTSCGVLLARERPEPAILVLRIFKVHDLPKGRREPGEDELACALRELREETAIPADAIEILPDHRLTTVYEVRSDQGPVRKTLIVFPARLARDAPIRLTEHHGWRWWPWRERATIPGRVVPTIVALAEKELGGPPWR